MKAYQRKIIGGHLSIAIGLILSIITIGTIGYIKLENSTPLNALYHTVITITTVGYADAATKAETKIFTMAIALAGVASFYYLAGAIAETLIAGRLFEVLKLRRIEDVLAKAKNHVILCGYGDVGTLTAERIKDIVIIEKKEDRFDAAIKKGFACVKGDSTNPETLELAGIKKAKAMIIALNSDPEVVYTILTAKEANPDIKIYARANETISVNKMKKAGANYVICLPEVGSRDLLNALEGLGDE